MQTILRSKIFLSFFIVITLASLVFFFNSAPIYQSEMDILLIPKSEVTAKNADKIQNDTKEIITSLKFYDNLLDKNLESTELSLGRNAAERKSDWQKKLSVKKSKNSNILKIFADDKNKAKAENLSQNVAQQTSETMSQYYNIKTDLEIRIIDGPVSEKNLNLLNFSVWILSFLFGIAGGLMAFLIFNSIEVIKTSPQITFKKLNPEETKSFQSEKPIIYPVEEPYVFNSEIKPVEENQKSESEIISEDAQEIFPLEDLFPIENFELPSEDVTLAPEYDNLVKKAAAPANLPVADDSGLNFQTEEQSSENEIAEILEKAHDHDAQGVREATPEEVKARLNRLLKGDL